MALLFHLSISKTTPMQLRVPLAEYQEHARVEGSVPATDIQRIALGAEMSLVRYSGLALWPCVITIVTSEQLLPEELPIQPVTGTVTWTAYGDDWKGIYNSPGVAVLDDAIRLGLLDYVAWLYDNRGTEYAPGVRKFFATLRKTSF